MLKMQLWRAIEAQNRVVEGCRPAVADSDHFDEELDPDPHWSERWIQIRIKVMRIRNPAIN